jgi:hypothetical protein
MKSFRGVERIPVESIASFIQRNEEKVDLHRMEDLWDGIFERCHEGLHKPTSAWVAKFLDAPYDSDEPRTVRQLALIAMKDMDRPENRGYLGTLCMEDPLMPMFFSDALIVNRGTKQEKRIIYLGLNLAARHVTLWKLSQQTPEQQIAHGIAAFAMTTIFWEKHKKELPSGIVKRAYHDSVRQEVDQ